MPTKKNDNEEKIVKNIDIDELDKLKKKEKKEEDIIEDDNEIEDVDNDDDDDDDDEDDEDDDDDDDSINALTDMGLFHILRNYLVDNEDNNVATSLSNISKELAKLNHTVKKFVAQAEKKK